MKDYYSVLGINKNATDDEVKAAYKEMAKKYHPDNYADNPLSDLAAEKMKEINEAYDGIMNERRRRKTSSSNGAGGNYYSANSNFSDVRSLIMNNRLEEAQEVLDGVPPERRDAEWYFLNGTVLYKRGWFDNAYTNFATACRMDPMNAEYREAMNRVQRSAGGNFNNPYRSAPNMGGMSACDCCSNLLCADCCCECMGGDLIPCC